MLASFLSLLTLATLAAAAFGLGRPMIRALGVAEDDALTNGVLSIGAGLIVAGVGLSALGFAGMLERSIIGVLTVAAAFYGVAQLGRAWRLHQRIAKSIEAPSIKPVPPAAPIRQAMFWLAAIAAGGSLVAALAPPTAGDALCYHLELPKRFLLERAIVFLPDSDNSTFPLLTEMWYLWALALDGPVAAQLVHWGLGLLLALATTTLATPILGRPWAWCAAAAVLLMPGVSNQMTAPLNDVAVAAIATLALSSWWRAAVDQEHPRWYLLAGWYAGGALAIKYVAILYITAMIVVTCVAVARRGRWRSLIAGGAAAAAIAASVCGPWYLRSAWHTGNPVYPFFENSLACIRQFSLFSEPKADRSSFRSPHSSPCTASIPHSAVRISSALSPWQLTMHPERFGGRGHQLGILFLATLPGLLLCRRLRGLRMLLSIGLLYFLGWYLLRPNVRFLLPIVPLLCVAVVWVWMECRRLPAGPRRCLVCLTAAMLLVSAAISPLRARERWPVALGIESREAYLLRREPSYQAAAWANALLAPDARILSQEQRAFYFNIRVARENVFRRRTHYDRRLASPGLLSQTLRAAGFTHLLLAEGLGGGIHYNSTLSRLADQALSARRESMECLAECHVEVADGAVRRYRLIGLQ